jgi:hypothetical protein
LGTQSLGSTSDYSKWIAMATLYLSNGIKGPFYSEPKDIEQLTLNKAALESLQREQETLLAKFFALNHSVLLALTDALLVHFQLGADALKPFLERVRFPEGFPIPKDYQ